ncbi:MAG: hypothetical protein KF839_11360 [Nitrosomonas sp.]|nr:hypothetical protein [Nitrosomonas sp.]
MHGFVYLWALFAVAVAGIVMAGTGQVWKIKSQREKEAELLFIGEQFRKAVMSYYNSPGGTKEYPKSLRDLIEDTRLPATKHHLRKIYIDPITNTTEWGLIEEAPPSTGTLATSNVNVRIIGVHSLSEKKPIKNEKFPEHYKKFSEALTYRDWKFAYKPGDTSGSTNSTSQQQKTNTPGTTSPFAPQSPSTTGGASPSKPSSTGGASPFSQQPSTAPGTGGGSTPSSPFGN